MWKELLIVSVYKIEKSIKYLYSNMNISYYNSYRVYKFALNHTFHIPEEMTSVLRGQAATDLKLHKTPERSADTSYGRLYRLLTVASLISK